VETEYKRFYEGLPIEHWVNKNSLKLYDHLNIGCGELTINDVEFFKVFRASQADPDRALSRGINTEENAGKSNSRVFSVPASLCLCG
jgi:hypothetical protein